MALLEVVNFPHVQIIPFFLAGANFMNLTCSHCARSAMKRCLLSSRRDWKKQSRQLAESSSLKTEHFYLSSNILLYTCQYSAKEAHTCWPLSHTQQNDLSYYNLNSLTSASDQCRVSPYNINTMWSRKMTRIKKSNIQGIICWSNVKLSKIT